MEGNYSKNKFFLVLALLNMAATLVKGQGTRVGFYSTSCPLVESIVSSTVQSHLQSDPSLGPAILRMHFHDCFVHGCDASILINGPDTEKTAPPNLGVRGYEVIDEAKAQVEATCPGVVSCADILALAARDAVFLAKGQKWDVPTGRRDGKVSLASDADNLPAFTDSIEELKRKFAAFGLNARDLVTLVERTPLEPRLANFSAIDYSTSMQPATAQIHRSTLTLSLNSEHFVRRMGMARDELL